MAEQASHVCCPVQQPGGHLKGGGPCISINKCHTSHAPAAACKPCLQCPVQTSTVLLTKHTILVTNCGYLVFLPLLQAT